MKEKDNHFFIMIGINLKFTVLGVGTVFEKCGEFNMHLMRFSLPSSYGQRKSLCTEKSQ